MTRRLIMPPASARARRLAIRWAALAALLVLGQLVSLVKSSW